jgi:hypothetical protein
MRVSRSMVAFALVAGVLPACGSSPRITPADGASLGQNDDTNVMRVALDASVPITVDCKAPDLIGKGNHVVGPSPQVSADDPSVLVVAPRGGDGWSLEGRSLGETILEVSGECEGRYPVRVVAVP